jgi:hypothetical protein
MKFAVLQSDVIAWGCLNGRPSKLVLAASPGRISTVIVDGEDFRLLGLKKEAEMC